MRICAIGLGRLGLPWALVADAVGHDVIGVDVDPARVEAVNTRTLDTTEPEVSALLRAGKTCRLRATTRMAEAIEGADVTVVMVPTPSEPDGSFGAGAVLDAVGSIGALVGRAAEPHVVVVVSTVSPGAIQGAVKETLEAAAGRRLDSRLGLVYAPEFHAIGSIVSDLREPGLLLLGGEQDWADDVVDRLLTSLTSGSVPVRRLSTASAELAKLAFNVFLTTKISFANLVGELCGAYGADGPAVCAVLGEDRRVGAMFFRPGAPFGGPCFPRDNPALAHAARAVGIAAELPAAVEAINQRRYAVLEHAALAASDGPIGLAGLAFKPRTDETEGSPAIELARRWLARGRQVVVYDPLVAGDTVPGARAAESIDELVESSGTVVLMNDDPELAELVRAARTRKGCRVPLIDAWADPLGPNQ
jgi:UDPglucose 6-dehydrogenase